MIIKKILGVVAALLYPPRCPVCDMVVLPWNKGICSSCMKKIKYVATPRCCKCGKHIEDVVEEFCPDCQGKTHYYIKGRALYEYKELAPSIYRFKYAGRREYAEVFGEEIAYYLKDFFEELQPDALVPVPMHPTKERVRGYNQATLLAQAIGRYTQIPVYQDLVKRIRNTRPLKYLNPEERLNNLKKAFILRENGVKLNVIVIIDDIYTTGSTIDAIARVLQEDKERKVYFITLAIGETI